MDGRKGVGRSLAALSSTPFCRAAADLFGHSATPSNSERQIGFMAYGLLWVWWVSLVWFESSLLDDILWENRFGGSLFHKFCCSFGKSLNHLGGTFL